MPQKLIDELGNQYGYLKVIGKGKTADNRTGWICECQLCGNKKIIRGPELRKGKYSSCGCKRQSIKQEEIGKKYGFLTVLAQDPKPAKEFADNSIHWLCQCELCGTIKSISGRNLRKGDSISCGCIKSFGETCVAQYLNKNNIKYIKEYTYSELIGDYSNLRFDFAIFDNDLQGYPYYLIEYNGGFHYQTTNFDFHNNTPNALQKRQEYDLKKFEFCLQNKISLYIIKNQKDKKDQNKINAILDFIQKDIKENKYAKISIIDIDEIQGRE